MKKLLKVMAVLALTLCSANVSAKSISSSDIESSYIKCEMNEKGQLTPNYFVVVDGISYQTDSKTFHLIQKSKSVEVQVALNIDLSEMVISLDKAAIAER